MKYLVEYDLVYVRNDPKAMKIDEAALQTYGMLIQDEI